MCVVSHRNRTRTKGDVVLAIHDSRLTSGEMQHVSVVSIVYCPESIAGKTRGMELRQELPTANEFPPKHD